MSPLRKVFYAGAFAALPCEACGGGVSVPFWKSMAPGLAGTVFVVLLLLGVFPGVAAILLAAVAVQVLGSALDLLFVPLVRAGRRTIDHPGGVRRGG